MAKFKQKACSTCGALHFGKLTECWHCIRAKKIDENPRYCVVCERKIPRTTGRGASHYCGFTCSYAVGEARDLRVSRVTAREIKQGRMLPARAYKCVDCGAQAKDYDHREYLKPLQVVPVCRGCNLRRGPTTDVKAFVAEHLKVSIDRLGEELSEMRARRKAEMAARFVSFRQAA